MIPDCETGEPFIVLNPDGRDADQSFSDGPGTPQSSGHAPVNYHAYAACVRGSFLRSSAAVPENAAVLLLLRRDLRHALRALKILHKKQACVFVSWKESGLHQVALALNAKNQWERFQEICAGSKGALASTPDIQSLYQSAGSSNVHFLATPYPVDFPEWNFEVHQTGRAGVFVGTRECDVATRHHDLAVEIALSVAENARTHVTIIDNGSMHRWQRNSWSKRGARFVRGPLPYPEYLRLIAAHRAVFQLDRSAVPGQVAGDCLLARVLCIGGDGAVDREAFPETCGSGRAVNELAALLEKSLTNHAWWEEAEKAVKARAMETISFSATAPRLRTIFRYLENASNNEYTD
jgi:hypothetical protein